MSVYGNTWSEPLIWYSSMSAKSRALDAAAAAAEEVDAPATVAAVPPRRSRRRRRLATALACGGAVALACAARAPSGASGLDEMVLTTTNFLFKNPQWRSSLQRQLLSPDRSARGQLSTHALRTLRKFSWRANQHVGAVRRVPRSDRRARRRRRARATRAASCLRWFV